MENPIDSADWAALLQTQSNIATIAISVVSFVAVLVVGATWLFNLRISSVLVKREMEKHLDKAMREFFKLKNTEMERRLNLMQAEICRSFAITAEINKMWLVAALWWGRNFLALNTAAEQGAVGLESFIRISVDGLLSATSYQDWYQEIDEEGIQLLLKVVDNVPKLLASEKDTIHQRVKDAQKKATGQSTP